MTERAYVISKINEAANEIINLLPRIYRIMYGNDLNDIIISAMRGDNYIEHDDRNNVVGEWRSVFSFVNERFGQIFDIGDEEDRKSIKTLHTRSLEVDRMIQIYLTL